MTTNETQSNTAIFAYLKSQKYILLKTLRKSGVVVATPVWFAEEGRRLYIVTTSTSGKIKRIHNNRHVLLAPCDRRGKILGEEITGQAKELPANEHPHAHTILDKKFGLLYQIFMLMGNLGKSTRTYIEIVPEK